MPSRLPAAIAFLLALLASAFFLVAPVYQGAGQGASIKAGGGSESQSPVQVQGRNLVQQNGAGVLLWLALPPALSGLALLLLHRTRFRSIAYGTAALLLLAFAVVSVMSIGLFYLPGALAMTVAAALSFFRS